MPVRSDGAASCRSSTVLAVFELEADDEQAGAEREATSGAIGWRGAVPMKTVASAQAVEATRQRRAPKSSNRASRISNDTIGRNPAAQTMNVRLTDDQQLLRQTVREFAEAELRPHVMEWDEAQAVSA